MGNSHGMATAPDQSLSNSLPNWEDQLSAEAREMLANNRARSGPASSNSPPYQDAKATARAKAKARNKQRHTGAATSSSPHNKQDLNAEGECEGGEIESGRGKSADQFQTRKKLSINVRRRIVELFATFQTVSVIRDVLKTEFGLSLAPQTIQHYDPERSRYLSPKLRAHAAAIRERYVTDAAKVAVAHQAHRLRKIEDIVEKATISKDYASALKGLELAAKEMGGLSQTVEHKGIVSHVHGSVDDARAELSMRLQTLLDNKVANDGDACVSGQTPKDIKGLDVIALPPPTP